MRLGSFFPLTFPSLIWRYLMVSALRGGWPYVNYRDFSDFISGLVPNTQLDNLIFYQINKVMYGEPQVEWIFVTSVLFILALYQWMLILGAIWLAFANLRSGDGRAAAKPLDGRGLRRLGWARPLTMTVSIIFGCYGVVWAFLLLGNSQRPGFTPFYKAFEFAGPWPLAVGALLGLMGAVSGYRFSSNSRSLVGSLAGAQYLSADNWLTERVHALADKLEIPRPAVAVCNVMNAFAAGSSINDAAVVMGVPLIKMLELDEIDAIIGHELGHIVSSDMQQMQFAAGYQQVFGTTIEVITQAGAQMTREKHAGVFIQLAGLLLHSTVMFSSELMAKRLSRSREFYADAVGAGLTSPAAMIRALEKINNVHTPREPIENRYGYLMFRGKSSWSFLFSTHPSLERRRRALLKESYLRMLPRKAEGSAEYTDQAGHHIHAAPTATAGLSAVAAALESAPSPGYSSLYVEEPRTPPPPLAAARPAPPRSAKVKPRPSWLDTELGSLRSRLAQLAAAAAVLGAFALLSWTGVDPVIVAVEDGIGSITGFTAREDAITARENELGKREYALKQAREALDARSTTLARREADVASRESIATYRENTVSQKEAALDLREQALAQRPTMGPAPVAPYLPGSAPGQNPAEQVIATMGPVISGVFPNPAVPPLQPAVPPAIDPSFQSGTDIGVKVVIMRGTQNDGLFRGRGSQEQEAFGNALMNCTSAGNKSCYPVATLSAAGNNCLVVAANRLGRKGYGIGPTLRVAGERAVADCRRASIFGSCTVVREQNYCLTQ